MYGDDAMNDSSASASLVSMRAEIAALRAKRAERAKLTVAVCCANAPACFCAANAVTRSIKNAEKAAERGTLCPTCGETFLSAFQIKNGYHCASCTRDADPEGARREAMGW